MFIYNGETSDDLINKITVATEALNDEIKNFVLSNRITNVLQAKVKRGDNLTDEEIFVATESIGTSFLFESKTPFKGFGLETYADKNLSNDDKTKVVVAALEEANEEKAKATIAKAKDLSGWWDKYKAGFEGTTGSLKKDAKQLLMLIEDTPDEHFKGERIKNSDVSLAVQRGEDERPFDSFKDVLKGIALLSKSLEVVASSSRYENLSGGEGGKYDLARLASDMTSHKVGTDEDRTIYDLNPAKVTGYELTMTIPSNSSSGYLMRNLKANFVISFKGSGRLGKSQGITVDGLSKSESIGLLKSVISHIENQEHIFSSLFKTIKVGLTGIIKGIAKSIISPLLGYNSAIFRARMESLAFALFHINFDALRGLITWAGKSVTK